MKPLVIDLCCGLFGWSKGFIAEGYRAIGFDIARVGPIPEGAELVLQDMRTLHRSQLRHAAAIVASPPCQRYSYMAMPWGRSKRLAAWYREDPARIVELNEIFDAVFRIRREASEAAGREIPLAVENVNGAQRWVGSAAWHFGSFYLWGDIPALMPFARGKKNSGGSWFGQRDGETLERNDPRDMRRNENGEYTVMGKTGGNNHPMRDIRHRDSMSRPAQRHRQENGVKQGGNWWHDPESMTRKYSSRSDSRKAGSQAIAEIPADLARWIAKCFKPY